MNSAAGQGGTGGCQVYVGNLPWETTWMNLKDHFREAGNVVHADVALDPEGKVSRRKHFSRPSSPHPAPLTAVGAAQSRGFGTVLFGSTRDAAKAIQLFNESFLLGRKIEVRPDQHADRPASHGGGGHRGGWNGGVDIS